MRVMKKREGREREENNNDRHIQWRNGVDREADERKVRYDQKKKRNKRGKK